MDGLSVERLTLLGRVHVARVVIDSLTLPELLREPSTPTKNKAKVRGRPPRPKKKTGCVFSALLEICAYHSINRYQ